MRDHGNPAGARPPFVGEKAIISYPVREFAGAVWIYFEHVLRKKTPEPVFPEEITSDKWFSLMITTTWNGNWQVALDNRLDHTPSSYLHVNTFTLAHGKKDSE